MSQCLKTMQIKDYKGDPQRVPCGQCINCRLEKARQWAVRCVHEAQLYAQNCFITLTYSDEHIPQDHSIQKKYFRVS